MYFQRAVIEMIIDVLQTGQETDFILVSCTGLGIEPTRREQVLKAKRVSRLFSVVPFTIVIDNVHFYICSHKYCSLFLKMFPGWGRFIEKIRPRIHNHSSWSPKGKANNCYPKFRQVCQFSLTSFICISFGLENVCLSVACL